MLKPSMLLILSAGILGLGGPARPGWAQAAEQVVAQWRFDTDNDLQGWVAGGHLAEIQVRDGALNGRATDWDPILLGPVCEIPATATQRIEISLRCTEDSRAELFWTETLEGQHGGFSQEKYASFAVTGDGRYHVYRVRPFWHAAGKIVRLRFDPPNKGRFEWAGLRIVDRTDTAKSDARAWQFDASACDWQTEPAPRQAAVQAGALQWTVDSPEAILWSPALRIATQENSWISIQMAASGGTTGRIHCATSRRYGSGHIEFPLRPDGRMRTYNVFLGSLSVWRDDLVLVGLQPTDEAGGRVRIRSIEIADQPQGAPDLEVEFLGSTAGVNRVGRPVEISALVRNQGGQAAEKIVAALRVPEGVRVLPGGGQAERISPWLPQTLSWQIEASQPGPATIRLDLSAEGVPPLTSDASIDFTLPPQIPATDYIPPPQPVRANVDLGVFYFPGWGSRTRWQPILDFPKRKPVLGWYDEANPECADWQIKWAVEHGVKFFLVDWYWVRGQRHLEHWLHDAYPHARFRSQLQWCVMWANHNPPNTHSREDWRNVTQYWIDHYFKMPEYYRIDGRPAVFLWAPRNIRQDVGGSEQAAELYAMSQQMAREAGLPGIYFAAMSSHESAAACDELKAEGYEGFTSYHGFQLAERRAGSKYFGFDKVVETAGEVWQAADARASGLEYFPIVDTGWASEPWHRSEARVISGRTPELFGQLCRQAADYAAQHGKRIVAIGPWNEWGEGSYIEPYAEYGFGDLNRMREAFCPPGDWPPNVIPSDVGRGPYDFPPQPVTTRWTFDQDGDLQGWTHNSVTRVRVADGLLHGQSAGTDPILQAPGVMIEADQLRTLVVRMRSDAEDRAQLFWGTTMAGQSEANSVRFALVGDGQLHEYQVDLGSVRTWRGVVTSLRFDPVNKPGVQFAIDSIEVR